MTTARHRALEAEAATGRSVAAGLVLRRVGSAGWTARHAEGAPHEVAEDVEHTCEVAALRGVGALGPTTAEQRRMERYTRTGRAPISSNACLRIDLHGSVAPVSLQAVVTSLVWRHEGLRTAYAWYGDHLVQEVRATPRQAVQVLADRVLAGASDAVVEEWCRQRASVAFDVGREPPITWCYARRSACESVLLVNAPHLVADGWAWSVVFDDLQALYGRLASSSDDVPGPWLGGPREQPSWTPIDFAVREVALLTPERLAWIEDEWRRELDGATLSPGFCRHAGGASVSARVVRTISACAARHLKALARAAGVSDFTTHLTTFAATLCLETDGRDPVVVIAAANRRLPQDSDLVMCCRNTVPVRCALGPTDGLLDVTRAMGERIMQAMEREAYSVELLQGDARGPASEAQPPVTTFQHESDASQSAPASSSWGALDVVVRDVPVQGGDARVELSLLTVESSKGVTGQFEFDAGRLSKAVVERMADRWLAVVDLAATPERAVVSAGS